jgi:hypothetical protein
MKFLLSFIFLLVTSVSFGQNKEVIKIEVSKDCQSYVSKRTYKNEVYSQEISAISDILNKISFVVAFKEHQNIIYLKLNDYALLNYDFKTFGFKIDDKEILLGSLVDYQKTATTNGLLEQVNVFNLGFELTEELSNSINNCKALSLFVNHKERSGKKTWELSQSEIGKIKGSISCVKSHSLPIQQEYESSLKEFETDFRNSKWSYSQSQVIESEQSIKDQLLITDNEIFVSDVKLNNDNFNVLFLFHENKLYKGTYSFDNKFVNENNYYNKYKSLKSLLEKKYGVPKAVNQIRKGDLFDDPNEIGRAIETGYYSESTIWETKSSFIKLIISGENFKTHILIIYTSKDQELMKSVSNVKEKESLEGF